MKKLLLVIGAVFGLAAQDGAPVSVSAGPPYLAYEKLFFPGASGVDYICTATSRTVSTITVTAASNANPVSFTATAHNIGEFGTTGATIKPLIKIAGGTGAWTVINGIWAATITSADAFTIPVNSTSLGALAGTLVVTTMAPRVNVAQWSVQHLTYDGSGNVTSQANGQKAIGAGGTSLIGATTGAALKCSDRALLAFE